MRTFKQFYSKVVDQIARKKGLNAKELEWLDRQSQLYQIDNELHRKSEVKMLDHLSTLLGYDWKTNNKIDKKLFIFSNQLTRGVHLNYNQRRWLGKTLDTLPSTAAITKSEITTLLCESQLLQKANKRKQKSDRISQKSQLMARILRKGNSLSKNQVLWLSAHRKSLCCNALTPAEIDCITKATSRLPFDWKTGRSTTEFRDKLTAILKQVDRYMEISATESKSITIQVRSLEKLANLTRQQQAQISRLSCKWKKNKKTRKTSMQLQPKIARLEALFQLDSPPQKQYKSICLLANKLLATEALSATQKKKITQQYTQWRLAHIALKKQHQIDTRIEELSTCLDQGIAITAMAHKKINAQIRTTLRRPALSQWQREELNHLAWRWRTNQKVRLQAKRFEKMASELEEVLSQGDSLGPIHYKWLAKQHQAYRNSDLSPTEVARINKATKALYYDWRETADTPSFYKKIEDITKVLDLGQWLSYTQSNWLSKQRNSLPYPILSPSQKTQITSIGTMQDALKEQIDFDKQYGLVLAQLHSPEKHTVLQKQWLSIQKKRYLERDRKAIPLKELEKLQRLFDLMRVVSIPLPEKRKVIYQKKIESWISRNYSLLNKQNIVRDLGLPSHLLYTIHRSQPISDKYIPTLYYFIKKLEKGYSI